MSETFTEWDAGNMTGYELSEHLVRIAAAADRTDDQVAEDFFFDSLGADPVLGGVRFDIVAKGGTCSRAGLQDRFGLVLVNGREVLVVEVKYEAHENDLRRLVDKKAANFRRLFPEYADREQRLALAAFRVRDELKREALERGVTVLQRKGDVIETTAA